MSNKDLIDQLADAVEAKGGIGEFSKKSGIKRQTLYKLFKFKNSTLKTIRIMMNAMDDMKLVLIPLGEK